LANEYARKRELPARMALEDLQQRVEQARALVR
jgi:hypothetical protein